MQISRREVIAWAGTAFAMAAGGLLGLEKVFEDPAMQDMLLAAQNNSAQPLQIALPAQTGAPAGPPADQSQPLNLFIQALRPFINQSLERRAVRKKTEPDYGVRIDDALNLNRVNFLLFGYSEEHGEGYLDFGGSPSVLSYNAVTGVASFISFTRDLYAPELKDKIPGQTEIMRHVFVAGGFPLLRTVLENATGLVMDYQAVMKDTVLFNFIDQITGPISVTVASPHDGGTFRFNGIDQPGRIIPAGQQTMDALTAMAFLESEDQHPAGRADDRSYRKSVIYAAVAQAVQQRPADTAFVFKLRDFIEQQVKSSDLMLDFPLDLTARAVQSMASIASGLLTQKGDLQLAFPEFDENHVIVISDPQFGDPQSGVSRVFELKQRSTLQLVNGATGHPDPAWTLAAAQSLPDWVQLAEGNPKTNNPPQNYWASVRSHIKTRLA